MSSEEDRWHVRFAPGEVKLLTLEQIDDLFRLDMIDEDTLLRQDGTEQWLPLRVVAGLDEEVPPAPVVRSAPPPPSARSAPPPPSRSAPPPPSRSAPPPPSARSAPPPPSRSAPPPPPPPAPPPVYSAPPPPPAPLPPPASERAPFAPSPSFIPPAAVAHDAPPTPSHRSPTPSVPAPSFALAAPSAAPLSIAPPVLPPRARRTEPLLIALVGVLGLLITLHRNGVLASLFVSTGQAAAYERLETTLGGPGFGTPRAIDTLVAKARSLTGSTAPRDAKH